jgi:hypothetical protein
VIKIHLRADFYLGVLPVAKLQDKGVPSMGGNQAVKVRYALGSRKHEPKARVSTVRWNLKEAGGKIPNRRTGTVYKAEPGRTSLPYKAKSNATRTLICRYGGYMG